MLVCNRYSLRALSGKYRCKCGSEYWSETIDSVSLAYPQAGRCGCACREGAEPSERASEGKSGTAVASSWQRSVVDIRARTWFFDGKPLHQPLDEVVTCNTQAAYCSVLAVMAAYAYSTTQVPMALTHERWGDRGEKLFLAAHGYPALRVLHLPHQPLHLRQKINVTIGYYGSLGVSRAAFSLSRHS